MLRRARSSLAGKNRWPALFGALIFHACVLAFLVVDGWLHPRVAPLVREIPVEIVVEQPQPKPSETPQPKAEPTPPAQERAPDLEPATDAPRAANKEKVERQAPDDVTRAPGPPTEAQSPKLSPKPDEATGPTQPSEASEAENAAAPVDDALAPKNPAETARQAPPEQEARAEPNASPEKLPTMVGMPFPEWLNGKEYASDEATHEIELGSAAEETPVSGGKARATYPSELYAMIMPRVHPFGAVHARGRGRDGAIVFTIDGMGNLIDRHVVRTSGIPELDAAALAAIGEAAPFPAPPRGHRAQLRFTYSAQ